MARRTRERHGVLVELTVPCDQAELAADALFGEGAEAVVEEAAEGDTVRVVAFLPDRREVPNLPWPARAVFPPSMALSHTPLLRVGDLVIHDPREHPDVGEGERSIVIDSNGAFGHGSHPSTRLALEALVAFDPCPENVLDVGCGTGILALAAAASGSLVLALDVDPAARSVCAANAARNGLVVEVDARPLDELEGTYELVLANLLLPALEELALGLGQAVRPGGTLVVSGILDHQADRLLGQLPAWPVRRRHQDGWCCLILSRPVARRPSAAL